MSDFVVQQRCFNSAEPELGLGIVMVCDHRTVQVYFPATEQTRTYARQTAPLIRAVFAAGDSIRDQSGQAMLINSVEEKGGFLYYRGVFQNSGNESILHEKDLDSHQQLTYPTDRLFSGQIDHNKHFELRYLAHQIQYRLARDKTRGLKGGRTLLLPHQLYIANEVASRHSPRVLLADEVGLGKTIEAGLIIHQQLMTGRAQRVLILVPESLLHQWLVEMLRRFNLVFTLLDADRCESYGRDENPFEQAQLILASLDFVTNNPTAARQALDCDWDLLVIDEAHHLSWTPETQSPEYQLVDLFAQNTAGLILLTATPEQTGQSSYFACLRLLDPERFHSLEAFRKEEQQFSQLAQIADNLLGGNPVEGELATLLESIVDEIDERALLDRIRQEKPPSDQRSQDVEKLIDHLIDRHGTGRVLFRNTRKAISGFPQRQLNPVALPCPDAYRQTSASSLEQLYPERSFQAHAGTASEWIKVDPRVPWLVKFLSDNPAEKCLLITAQTDTALELAEWLKKHSGIRTGLFNEKMSLLERDRTAAYFADQEDGAQLLVCSEIGSEGRNFQFAHHLVLFDLPINPDLLEQRIGRLDRIGQTHTIQIHALYLEDTAQQRLFQWYQQGLGAFTQHCRGGAEVFKLTREKLVTFLENPGNNQTGFAKFLSDCQKINNNINTLRENGRDRLLEFHSNHPSRAGQLIAHINHTENETELLVFLEKVVDSHALEMEIYRQGSYLLKPDLQADNPEFPLINAEGLVFTCNRNTALSNENFQFFTWEHPIVMDALERITSQEVGNNALVVIEDNQFRTGTLLLECLFLLSPPPNVTRQGSRYLPPQLIRVLIDSRGNDYSDSLSHAAINQLAQTLPGDTAKQLIEHFSEDIRNGLSQAKTRADACQKKPLEKAEIEANQTLDEEIRRLATLARINRNVHPRELEALAREKSHLQQLFRQAQLQLDALRVIVAG